MVSSTGARKRARISTTVPSSNPSRSIRKNPTFGRAEDDDDDAEDTRLLTSTEVEDISRLRNLTRFMAMQHNVRVIKETDITLSVIPAIRRDWQTWVSLPRVHPSKICTRTSVLSQSDQWSIKLRDHRVPMDDSIPPQKRFTSTIKLSKALASSKDDAAELVDMYCMMIERLPFEITKPRHQNSVLIRAAAHINRSGRTIRVPINEVRQIYEKWPHAVVVAYTYIDEGTGAAEKDRLILPTHKTYANFEIPSIPDHVEANIFTEPAAFAKMSDQQKQRQRPTFRLATYLAHRLDSHITNKAALEDFTDNVLRRFRQRQRLITVDARAAKGMLADLRSCRSKSQNLTWDQGSIPTSRIAPDYARLNVLISSIGEAAGKKFTRSGMDDCPYPFAGKPPTDWCWDTAWRLFECRLRRMWFDCNRHWETVDTAEALFLECLYQCSHPDSNSGEIFKLRQCLTVYTTHPLKFSGAHLHHGQQMRTGWPDVNSTHVSDYKADVCNVSIEAWMTNTMKHDFQEAGYEHLEQKGSRADIRSIPYNHVGNAGLLVQYLCSSSINCFATWLHN